MAIDEHVAAALDSRTAAVPSTYRRQTFQVAVAIADYVMANPDQPLGDTGRWSNHADSLFKRVSGTGRFDDMRISAVVWDKALAAAMSVVGTPR